jgi:hypothetical protein
MTRSTAFVDPLGAGNFSFQGPTIAYTCECRAVAAVAVTKGFVHFGESMCSSLIPPPKIASNWLTKLTDGSISGLATQSLRNHRASIRFVLFAVPIGSFRV